MKCYETRAKVGWVRARLHGAVGLAGHGVATQLHLCGRKRVLHYYSEMNSMEAVPFPCVFCFPLEMSCKKEVGRKSTVCELWCLFLFNKI